MDSLTIDAAKPAEVDSTIFAGLIDSRAKLATALNKSERTVIRMEKQGLPVSVVGTLRLYDPQKVRDWLLSHAMRHDAPRRGRPRKNPL